MGRIDVDSVGAPTQVVDSAGWITTHDMIEVDRVMIEDLHIQLMQMMENAGRHLARVTRSLTSPTSALVLAGSGGNGGGGLVAARHLTNAGVTVTVVSTRPPEDLTGVPAHQADILRRIEVPVLDGDADSLGPVAAARDADVIVDAVIGYSLRGAPRGTHEVLIDVANSSAAPVVSLDVPSGLDATSGATPGGAIRADATVTLAAPKQGLAGSPLVGELFVADISVPPRVIRGVGGEPVRFGPDGLVHVSTSL